MKMNTLPFHIYSYLSVFFYTQWIWFITQTTLWRDVGGDMGMFMCQFMCKKDVQYVIHNLVFFQSKNVQQAKCFSKSYTSQALWHPKTPYFQDSFRNKTNYKKLKLNFEKNSNKISEKLKNRQLQLSWFVKSVQKSPNVMFSFKLLGEDRT